MKAPLTPTTLIQRLSDVDADERQWFDFVMLYTPVIRAWLSLDGVTQEMLDDAVQDVFLRLVVFFRKNGYVRERARFRTLLGYVVRSVATDAFRVSQRHERQEEALPDADLFPSLQVAPDERVDRMFELATIEAAIDAIRNDPELAPLHRDVLNDCILGEENPTVFARRTGNAVNTIVRIRLRLRERIKRHAKSLGKL